MIKRSRACLATTVAVAGVCLSACGGGDASSTPVGAGGSSAPGDSGSDAVIEAKLDAVADAATDSLGSDGSLDVATTDGSDGSVLPDSADGASIDASDAGTESGVTCGRVSGPADVDRVAVVSFPYDINGGKAELYELLKLTSSGALSFTGQTFVMGRGMMGDAVFTPDGQVGIVAQDDGTLGVFRLDTAGKPEVVHAKFQGGFYAGRLVMHPSGDRLYVLDSEWANIGGGLYSVRIGCDGSLTDEGRIVEAKLPYSLLPIPGKQGTFALASKDVLGCTVGDDAHLLTLEPSIQRLGSVDTFADDEQIIASGAVTPDGKYVLFGDNSEISGFGNRVAVLEVGGSTLTARQVLADVQDPIAMLVSPYSDIAIVVSGYGNSIESLSYDPANASAPFSKKGPIAYVGAKPQLPWGAVMIERGKLKGRVLVVENEGVRMVQFTGQGAGVDDLGLTSAGGGMDRITGVVGVQP